MAKKNIIGIPSDISMYANQFSFFSRPLSRDLKDKVDIVLMGIPFDLGTTGRHYAILLHAMVQTFYITRFMLVANHKVNQT